MQYEAENNPEKELVFHNAVSGSRHQNLINVMQDIFTIYYKNYTPLQSSLVAYRANSNKLFFRSYSHSSPPPPQGESQSVEFHSNLMQ